MSCITTVWLNSSVIMDMVPAVKMCFELTTLPIELDVINTTMHINIIKLTQYITNAVSMLYGLG